MMMMDWGHPIFQHPREARRGVGRRCGRIFWSFCSTSSRGWPTAPGCDLGGFGEFGAWGLWKRNGPKEKRNVRNYEDIQWYTIYNDIQWYSKCINILSSLGFLGSQLWPQ
jgi:hypothetical protein